MTYTMEHFKADREKCAYKAYGSKRSDNGGFGINYSSILSRLIGLAGRYCDNYASDLFIYWQSVIERMQNPNYTGEKLILGFYENGIFDNEAVIKRYNQNSYYFRKIVTLEIVVEGNDISMYL